jgi:hypothetical protein
MNKQSEQMKWLLEQLTPDQKDFMNLFKTKKENGLLELSPSAIKKIIDEPILYFEEYVCGDFDDKESKAQKRGTLIHTLVLEPEEFKEKYSVLPEGLKAPEDRMLDVVMFVANNTGKEDSRYLGDHSEMILEYMKEINYHQTLVDDKKDPRITGDKKRLDKVLTLNNIVYFEHLLESKDKEIISKDFYEEALKKAELIKRVKEKERISIVDDSQEDVTYELELHKPLFLEKFNLKAIIDCLKIDIKKKKIFITDLKSIGGKLATTLKFDIEKYHYGIQAAVNYLVVKHFQETEEVQEMVEGIENFDIEFGFLFVDGNNTSKYVYVSKGTMERYIAELTALLTVNVKYHFDNFDFSAPYQYLAEDVIL